MKQSTQYLLLVDNNDTFLGKYEEKEICHTGQGIRHRAFVVCIFNDKDEILLQYRKHKRWDKFWDVTAISHVLHLPTHDETYQEAASRSLKKEMGIEGVAIKKIGGFDYFAKYGEQCENEYCAVLVGNYSGNIIPNPEDVYEYKWMEKEQFIADCKNNPSIYAPWTILAAEQISKDLSSRTQ